MNYEFNFNTYNKALMDFFLNKDSTLPELLLELVKTNNVDYHTFFEKLQTSEITFGMVNSETNIPKIIKGNSNCHLLKNDEYAIGYTFNTSDVNTVGTFLGKFTIDFGEGEKLIVPIKEKLFIHIQ